MVLGNAEAPILLPPQSILSGAALAVAFLVATGIEAPFVRRLCGPGWRNPVLASLLVNGVTTVWAVVVLGMTWPLAWLLALPVMPVTEWFILETACDPGSTACPGGDGSSPCSP